MKDILKAILRGVQMGLEIQDDGLDQPVFLKQNVSSEYHVGRASQLKWVKENFVDLGLPSGILWCKYNVGATCGNTPQSWYGDFYAWGELKPKTDYSSKTYKFCKAATITPQYHRETATKYNTCVEYGHVDNKTLLDPKDDIASVSTDHIAKMPTVDDLRELCSLPSKWVNNYANVVGLHGVVFTGNNGNELFIPASGYMFALLRTGAGCPAELWSNTLYADEPEYAFKLSYARDNELIAGVDYGFRTAGRPVRGVIK